MALNSDEAYRLHIADIKSKMTLTRPKLIYWQYSKHKYDCISPSHVVLSSSKAAVFSQPKPAEALRPGLGHKHKDKDLQLNYGSSLLKGDVKRRTQSACVSTATSQRQKKSHLARFSTQTTTLICHLERNTLCCLQKYTVAQNI